MEDGQRTQNRVPRRPHRVIATAPSNAEIICALGAEDCLVAVSPFSTFPPSLAALPKIGGIRDPDLERIVSLRPDLMVLRGHSSQLESLASQHSLAIYRDRTDSLDSLFVTIRDLGEILGRTESASDIIDSIRRGLDEVESASAGGERLRVLFTIRSPDRLAAITTIGRHSYIHDLIEIAGGRNLFGDMEMGYLETSLEEVIARKPDVVVEAMPGYDLNGAERSRLTQQWSEMCMIPAVERGRIHYLTEDYTLVPSPRIVLLARELQRLIMRDKGNASHS